MRQCNSCARFPRSRKNHMFCVGCSYSATFPGTCGAGRATVKPLLMKRLIRQPNERVWGLRQGRSMAFTNPAWARRRDADLEPSSKRNEIGKAELKRIKHAPKIGGAYWITNESGPGAVTNRSHFPPSSGRLSGDERAKQVDAQGVCPKSNSQAARSTDSLSVPCS